MNDIKQRLMSRRPPIEHEVDGFGAVRLRYIPSRDMQQLSDEKDKKLSMRKLFAMAVIDEGGNPVFTPEEVEEIEFSLLKSVTDKVLVMNGIDKEDAEKK